MSIIDDLQPSNTHFNPVTGKPYPLHVANPHANIDIIHSDVNISGGGGGSAILLYDFVDGTCTPFLRTINDGAVTDTDINGQPYTVAGEVRASCPTDTPPTPLPRTVVYSHKTSEYIVRSGYKFLSVLFENEGTINGQYAPAGYQFTHDYFDSGYRSQVRLNGTSYMVWEER